MKSHLLTSIVLAAVAMATCANCATAGDQVPFKGKIDGSYVVTVVPPIGTFVGWGTGYATHLGQFAYSFPHQVDFGSVPPVGIGTYSFTAANGDTLTADFLGYSVPVAPGFVLVTENAVVRGGTGRFAGATGAFVITRMVDQTNRLTTGSFEGSISSPGAAN